MLRFFISRHFCCYRRCGACAPHCHTWQALVLVLLMAGIGTQHAHADDDRQARIKAAVVFYIAKFIDWSSLPNVAAPSSRELCLYKSGALHPALESTFAGKVVQGAPFSVRKIDSLATSAVESCSVIFIARENHEGIRDDLKRLATRPLLTVCENDSLEWGACMMQIFPEANKARIAVDQSLATSSRLRISSELLGLAVVRPPGAVEVGK